MITKVDWKNFFFRPKNLTKRTDVQALRSISVIAGGLIYHNMPWVFPGGFSMVDVFFVISGYLMTTTIFKMLNRRETYQDEFGNTRIKKGENIKTLKTFYLHRMVRLLPASFFVLLVVMITVLLINQPYLTANTMPQVISCALFFQNYELSALSVDYWNDNTFHSPLQHYWSLSLEEQFYALWPLTLIILLTIFLYYQQRKKKFSVDITQKTNSLTQNSQTSFQKYFLIAIFLLVLIFFIFGWINSYLNYKISYFSLPSRVWELIFGGLIIFLPIIKKPLLKLILPWIGIGVLIFGFCFIQETDPYPGWEAMIPCLGTALVIWGGQKYNPLKRGIEAIEMGDDLNESKWSFANISRLRIVQYIAECSYSAYLWEWPCRILLPIIFGWDPDSTTFKILLVIILIPIIMLSHRYIEMPLMNRLVESYRKKYTASKTTQ